MTLLTFSSDWHIDINSNSEDFINAYKDFDGLLVIAGDFAEVNNKDSIFFSTFEDLFEINPSIYVVFICGNHEYYGSSIEKTHNLIHDWIEEKDMDRFYFLESEPNLFWGEHLLIGSTLWYPDTVDSWLLQDSINDFRQIEGFKPNVAHQLNTKAHEIFDTFPNTDNKKLWITHHLPSSQSINPQYKGDRLNCYFVDPTFEKLIEKHQPDFVIHGHSHNPVRYRIGKTWVLSNPYGYGNQNRNFNPLSYFIEI